MLGDGTAALTHAWGAVAETGTLVMTSSAASPASLAFLPELHIVAVARDSIVGSFEEAFGRLGASRMPRAVNLVSSPSRTSDIGGRSETGESRGSDAEGESDLADSEHDNSRAWMTGDFLQAAYFAGVMERLRFDDSANDQAASPPTSSRRAWSN